MTFPNDPIGNLENRVNAPLSLAQGPLVGDQLMSSFKDEMIKERVFRQMFGEEGQHIFTDRDRTPNMNETILPALLLSWRQETFRSNNVYLDGTIDATLCLPTMLDGQVNNLRRVASMIQRWMSGSMNLWDKNPGLIRFGYESEFDYGGMAAFGDGFKCPAIQIKIPFRYDLALMRITADSFDPTAPLDAADLLWVEKYLIKVIDGNSNTELIPQGVLSVTGETNV
jgi:hypothetical protein